MEQKELNNTRLKEQINALNSNYNQEIDRIKRFYELSSNETRNEIEERLRKHKSESEEFKAAYQKIQHENRDLKYKYQNEKSRVKDLEDQLQRLTTERFKLERELSNQIQRLKNDLNEQRTNFSRIREQSINELNLKINELITQNNR